MACSFLRMVPMHSKNMDLVRKVKFGSFFTWRQFSQKLFDNFFSIYARSFPRRVIMNCQKIWLNHSKGHFSRSKRFEKGQIWLFLILFANLLKSGLITFLYILHTASLGWYWSTVKRWISLNYSKGHFQGRKGQV